MTRRDIPRGTYKVGQRVRIDFTSDGTHLVGEVDAVYPDRANVRYGNGVKIVTVRNMESDLYTVTILEKPRLAEPKGLGAVVEADDNRSDGRRTRYVRFRTYGSGGQLSEWVTEDGMRADYWQNLNNPVILSEGHLKEEGEDL